MKLLYTMIRVTDLDRSIDFYTRVLGMTLLRREDYPEGGFTLAFVGYGGMDDPTLELTHNWDGRTYDLGGGWGHIAVAAPDLVQTLARLRGLGARVAREPGPMAYASPQRAAPEVIAFIEDPDGYRIELVEHG